MTGCQDHERPAVGLEFVPEVRDRLNHEHPRRVARTARQEAMQVEGEEHGPRRELAGERQGLRGNVTSGRLRAVKYRIERRAARRVEPAEAARRIPTDLRGLPETALSSDAIVAVASKVLIATSGADTRRAA